ncbi:Tetratricopeptide repeat-containing protein [Belliella buryatensis]|uniref:histidine kinase n=1 Tax=Belliella buryatensis TaxID=1500549 RepID=A0A239C871_9BACT|nr:tetratricopeptide repeat-containing sensor histidine kinase [Belliella buryatensis]SNS15821.1 Tetratricopeptide repeat-containing protein [Belliella buryatensis]
MTNSIFVYFSLLLIASFNFESAYAQNSKTEDIQLAISKLIDSGKTNDYELAIQYKDLAFDYYQNNEYNDALSNYLKAIAILKNQDQPKMLSECLHNVGNLRFFLGEYLSAIDYYSQALEIRKVLNDEKGMASGYNNIANVYSRLGNYSQAIDYYNQSIEIKEQLNDQKGITSSLKNIATIYYFQSNYINALETNLKALKISEAIQDSLGVAFVYNNMALIYEKQEKYTEALEFYHKSLSIKEAMNDLRGIAVTLHNIGKIYEVRSAFDSALLVLERSLDISRKIEDKEGISSTLNSLGMIYQSIGDYKNAEENFLASLKIDEELNDKRGILRSKNNLGQFYFNQGNLQLARSMSEAAIILGKELGTKEDLKDSYFTLSKIDEKEGKFQSALQNYQTFTAYRDSLDLLNLENKTAQLQAEYEYDKQLAIIKAEQKAIDLENEKELQAQKFQRNILLVYTMFILFVAFILYKNYQKQRREKERSEKRSLELEKANQIKAKIFSIIGHDLRSPINSLHQLLELYQNDLMDEDEFREVLPQLYKNVGGIMLVLDNLLKWSLVEMKMMQTNPKKISLTKSINTLKDFFSTLTEQKGIVIKAEIGNDSEVLADNDQVQVILRNLIGNAIKYSVEGGEILIKTTSTQEEVIISVRDCGTGMKPELVKKLFQNTLVESKTGTTGEKGTGLGLSLCKYYTEVNGGSIWVESEDGVGSTFYFSLPKAQVTEAILEK